MELAIAIITLGIMVFSGTAQQVVGRLSGDLRAKLYSLAKDIASAMSKNNSFKEQVLTAYQEKNSKLMNSLVYGMGFGSRMESIRKEIDRNKDEYLKQIREINNLNIKLENANNAVQGYIANTGTIGGNVAAEKFLNADNPVEEAQVQKAKLGKTGPGRIGQDSNPIVDLVNGGMEGKL